MILNIGCVITKTWFVLIVMYLTAVSLLVKRSPLTLLQKEKRIIYFFYFIDIWKVLSKLGYAEHSYNWAEICLLYSFKVIKSALYKNKSIKKSIKDAFYFILNKSMISFYMNSYLPICHTILMNTKLRNQLTWPCGLVITGTDFEIHILFINEWSLKALV